MKEVISCMVFMLAVFCTKAQANKHPDFYNLPDSAKATSFIATVLPPAAKNNKKWKAGIGANQVNLTLLKTKSKYQVDFIYPETAKIAATGRNIKTPGKHTLRWEFGEEGSENYKLFITSVSDSAENFTLYSGYIYLSIPNKWKLIGTCKIEDEWTTLKTTALFKTTHRGAVQPLQLTNAWYQRSNGSWKSILPADTISPVVVPLSNIDSLEQFAAEKALLEKDITAGKTAIQGSKDGVYYTIMKQGDGKNVDATDTVSVFYKGYLYADGKIFDETKDKPARFRFGRLIKGWQTGLPLCSVGGKIKLVILSGQAYAIRTRAAKIPPNSILVFEIEVVAATPSH
jgi:FKBP-type peptidyl-prolyl cis-trans isomerase FkpA